MDKEKIFPTQTGKTVTIVGVVLLAVIAFLGFFSIISPIVAGFSIAAVVAVFSQILIRLREKKASK